MRKPSDTEAKGITKDEASVLEIETWVFSLLIPFEHTLILKDAVYVASWEGKNTYKDLPMNLEPELQQLIL